MKHVSLILNVVLLIAVVVLYILHFNAKPEQVTERGETTHTELDVAYVNSDSLLNNYEFVKELSGKLESTRSKLEKEYENRARGLQSEIQSFQASVNNMTIGQARAVEEDLVKKEQNLRQYQERLNMQFMQEESKVQEEIYNKVSDYLKDYAKNNNLQLVLTYQKGSGVLFANEGLNITDAVVKGLNDAYNKKDSAVKSDTAKAKP